MTNIIAINRVPRKRVVCLKFRPGQKDMEADCVSNYDGFTVLPCRCCYPSVSDIITDFNTEIRVALEPIFNAQKGTWFYFAHPAIEKNHHYDIPWRAGEIIIAEESRLQIIFLGGLGSAGSASCYLVTDGTDAILIDCGMTVGRLDETNMEELEKVGEQLPSLYPDFSLIPEDLNLKAVFITHGHLDHWGGIPELIRYLKERERPIPDIYGPPFATALVASKMSSENIPLHITSINRLKAGEPITIGNMIISAFDVFHSVPNAFGYAVKHKNQEGKIVFSGDLKCRYSDPYDYFKTVATFQSLQPIDLLVLDSTNADREGWTGLESSVDEALIQTISQASGRVFISLFSTHMDRIRHISGIAHRLGRRFGLIGASFKEVLNAYDATGNTIGYGTGADILAVAGCQANIGSSAWQLSNGSWVDNVRIKEGDSFIFSASPIPGRGNAVREMATRLHYLGANVVLPENFPGTMFGYERAGTHVSGHGSSQDIASIIEASDPRFLMPVHAGQKQADATGQLALNKSLLLPPQIILCKENGSSIKI